MLGLVCYPVNSDCGLTRLRHVQPGFGSSSDIACLMPGDRFSIYAYLCSFLQTSNFRYQRFKVINKIERLLVPNIRIIRRKNLF